MRLRVASEAYAVPVENVLQVALLGEVTAVPGAPPEMLGVLSLRGHILPVVSLAVLLGIPAKSPPARLLVAEEGGRQAGFAIDDVSQVGELDDPTEETESDLLAGATLTGNQLIGVLDVPRIFESAGGLGRE